MLDVRRLAILEAVDRHGSFTAAANALNYTQSAVSQQVAALERETGVVLVERSGRRIWLTDAGALLVGHSRTILAAIGDAEADLAAVAGLRTGTVRLAAFPSAGAALVPRAVELFRDRHPGVDLVLTAAEPRAAVDGLRGGAFDVAVSLAGADGGDLRTQRALTRRPLLDDPFHAVVPAGHRLAGRARIRLTDLADEQWIATSPGGHPDADTLLSACSAAGFTPRVRFHVDDYLAAQGFIAVGAGVAILPLLALGAVRPDVVVRPLSPKVQRRVEVVTLRSARARPAVRALTAVLRAAARDVRE
jgi:DNA-binding transcriptional LysR family regulator